MSQERTLTMNEYKTCTKCLQTKPISAFHKLKDKHKARCADCIKEHWHANKQLMNSYSRKSYQKHRDKKLHDQKLYSLANPEIVKATKKRYLENNPINRKESLAKYRKKNAKQILAEKRNYYGNNSEKWLGYAEIRNKRLKSNFKVTTKEIIRLLQKPCVYCQQNASVEIDHIIPLARGGQHRIGNLIGSCLPCNRSKNAKFIMEWRLLQKKMTKATSL
jgi:5-methylcytosine-specific restriction endonuclease McrA